MKLVTWDGDGGRKEIKLGLNSFSGEQEKVT